MASFGRTCAVVALGVGLALLAGPPALCQDLPAPDAAAVQALINGPTFSLALAQMTQNVFPFNVTAAGNFTNGNIGSIQNPDAAGAQALALAGWSVGLEGFSMAINTLPPCSVLLPHVHGMATEFIVVLSGTMSNAIVPDMTAQANFAANNISGVTYHEYEVPAGSAFAINPRGITHTNINYGCQPLPMLFIHTATQPGFTFYPPADQNWPPAVMAALNYTNFADAYQPYAGFPGSFPFTQVLDNSYCGCNPTELQQSRDELSAYYEATQAATNAQG